LLSLKIFFFSVLARLWGSWLLQSSKYCGQGPENCAKVKFFFPRAGRFLGELGLFYLSAPMEALLGFWEIFLAKA
jgi:hypothetical protein